MTTNRAAIKIDNFFIDILSKYDMIEKADFPPSKKPLIAFYYNRPAPKGKDRVQKFTIFTSGKEADCHGLRYCRPAWRRHALSLQGNPAVKKRRYAHCLRRLWISLAGYAKRKKAFEKTWEKEISNPVSFFVFLK